jgi:hypothetical protein
MKIEPLFIRLANRKAGALEVIQSFQKASDDEMSVEIAAKASSDLPDISLFIKDFKEVLLDLIDNGVNQRVVNYINSYMKPSLCEVVDQSGGGRAGESRHIYIKDPKAPWVEAVVCYNLTLFIKAYGFQSIKCCPVCSKFFTDKGKYAKYCSESCKSQGGR